MIFSNQGNMYTFSGASDYKWCTEALIFADQNTDYNVCPVSWPKNCQISENEWLFLGGMDSERNGTKFVMKLDTKTQRLTKLNTEIPDPFCAHQVIFMPAKYAKNKKGSVYIFAGLRNSGRYQDKNFKYDIEANKWKQLPNLLQSWGFRISFNLLPLCDFKFILIVSSRDSLLFDTQRDQFIVLEHHGDIEPQGVQIGAFTLPIINQTSQSVAYMQDKDGGGRRKEP